VVTRQNTISHNTRLSSSRGVGRHEVPSARKVGPEFLGAEIRGRVTDPLVRSICGSPSVLDARSMIIRCTLRAAFRSRRAVRSLSLVNVSRAGNESHDSKSLCRTRALLVSCISKTGRLGASEKRGINTIEGRPGLINIRPIGAMRRETSQSA